MNDLSVFWSALLVRRFESRMIHKLLLLLIPKQLLHGNFKWSHIVQGVPEFLFSVECNWNLITLNDLSDFSRVMMVGRSESPMTYKSLMLLFLKQLHQSSSKWSFIVKLNFIIRSRLNLIEI